MKLNELSLGDLAQVESINVESRLLKRLNALGLLPGTLIELSHKAPFGDPLVITFRGFSLAIRKKDAQLILVNKKEVN